MPIDYADYPEGWKDFSWWVHHYRARDVCECTGQCGLHQPNPFTRRCTERHHYPAHFARGVIVLTVAHLCDCQPLCKIPEHVIAACQRCHLRIDRFKHALSRRARRDSPTLATFPQPATQNPLTPTPE